MKRIVAAGVQIAVHPNDPAANIAKAAAWLRRACAEARPDLVVFPESVTTGFAPALSPRELHRLVDRIPGRLTAEMQRLARRHRVHIVWPTYERGEKPGIVYNSAALIGPDGKIIGVYRKTHPFPTERLAGGGWTTPGVSAEVYETKIGAVGMVICYDGDFPELVRLLAVKGAEIVVRPSAFMRSFDIWEITNCARAYDNHVYWVAVNAVGFDAAGNHYSGGSMIVSPIARKLAQARGGEEIIFAELDPDPIRHLTYGSTAPMCFDHLEDRNLAAYDGVLAPARSRFKPARRIKY
ncbi:MAG TPA: carbon-nitrogen hydrolase family protein [bacterium]|nr:carbon-nitrogen hydrolase family protein [Chlamydiota bacterium]HOE26727.1 carbon-nitrogen hydrolase family protein [bacterium]HQM52107.1 carbon-nitrogen hydrolase family protein [bacterium]